MFPRTQLSACSALTFLAIQGVSRRLTPRTGIQHPRFKTEVLVLLHSSLFPTGCPEVNERFFALFPDQSEPAFFSSVERNCVIFLLVSVSSRWGFKSLPLRHKRVTNGDAFLVGLPLFAGYIRKSYPRYVCLHTSVSHSCKQKNLRDGCHECV